MKADIIYYTDHRQLTKERIMINTNIIIISGNLTADPDIRQTSGGIMTARFTVAVNKGDKGADFLPCVAFDKTAEAIRTHLCRGSGVIVRGSLHSNKYTDQSGANRTYYEITASSVEFIGGRKAEPQQAEPDLSDFEDVELEQLPFG